MSPPDKARAVVEVPSANLSLVDPVGVLSCEYVAFTFVNTAEAVVYKLTLAFKPAPGDVVLIQASPDVGLAGAE